MAEAYTRLMKLGAEEFGIHSFLASNTVTDDYYPALAGILFELAVRSAQATPAPASPSSTCPAAWALPYRPDQRSQRHRRHRRGRAQRAYEEILVPAGMGDVAIFTELGRFMLAPYGAPGYHRHPRKAHL